MTRPRACSASGRAVRVLQALARAPDGLTLGAVLVDIGEPGRPSQAATVTMLKGMRDDGRVGYKVPDGRSGRRGRVAGIYGLTAAGAHWLRERGFLPAQEDLEPVLETGAMRGEFRSVTRNQARAGQVPAGAVNWVFSLGATQ